MKDRSVSRAAPGVTKKYVKRIFFPGSDKTLKVAKIYDLGFVS